MYVHVAINSLLYCEPNAYFAKKIIAHQRFFGQYLCPLI